MNQTSSDSTDLIAMTIEIAFGWFGSLGLGWLYVGNIPRFATLFFGYWAAVILVVAGCTVITIGTLGIGYFCVLALVSPFHIAIPIISGLRLRDHVRRTNVKGSATHFLVVLSILITSCVAVMVVMTFFMAMANNSR